MMQYAEKFRFKPPAFNPAAANGPPKVIIIGAGIAGLSCGCYLQMNGIQTEILEAGELPGGLCTAWKRGQYVFDGCLRWLAGAHPPSAFHKMWRELGAINGRNVFVNDEILSIESPDGKKISVPCDLDKLAAEFKRIAPEDSHLIDQLICDVRRSMCLEPLDCPLELMPYRERMRQGLRYLPLAPVVFRWKNVPLGVYLARYKNDFLRKTLQVITGSEQMSALVLVMVLAFRARKDTGFVTGGSWDFAMGIADRYERLGGVFRYHAKVTRIRTENGRATAVECEDGTTIPAATVISCADGYATIYKMLDGRFVDKKIRFMYETCETFTALIQVSLGIKKVFPGVPHTLNLLLPERLVVDDQTSHDCFEVELFESDSSFCPEGTTTITVRLPTRYQYWIDLKKNDLRRYRAEKKNVLRKIMTILDQRLPGLAKNVERFDVATPDTFVRYTGNWRASYEGWLPTPRILGRRIRYTLPGLENFYMAGHWVIPGGGLPSAALSGREVAQFICAKKGKRFAATEP
ncbi:MAG TPA: NAD(P)/FAD-dependent oxidoreductase [Candidatus Acidoferrales bacterium]|jgi:phytoene dehydrogenase-like protein|nr:NAD(P)/FAD-dependent oxidoreductase [Candidatus Acidoferrales bacterium]